jgi:hypothetical protein
MREEAHSSWTIRARQQKATLKRSGTNCEPRRRRRVAAQEPHLHLEVGHILHRSNALSRLAAAPGVPEDFVPVRVFQWREDADMAHWRFSGWMKQECD